MQVYLSVKVQCKEVKNTTSLLSVIFFLCVLLYKHRWWDLNI